MKKVAFALIIGVTAASISSSVADESEKVGTLKQLAPGTVFNFVFSDGGKNATTILKMDGVAIMTETKTTRRTEQREYVGFTVGLGQRMQETMAESSRAKVAELFPLKVGKKASFSHSGVNDLNGWQWTNSDFAEVLSVETVTVPAGTFETFVIRTNMQNERWWGQSTCWYSPEVGYCVKRKWRSTSDEADQELASFTTP